MRLVGYALNEDVTGGLPDLDAISGIADGELEECMVGWVHHRFVIEADGKLYKLVVKGDKVTLIE